MLFITSISKSSLFNRQRYWSLDIMIYQIT